MTKEQLSPTIIFIFGGSGDLTFRKLIPALYNLYIDQYLPSNFTIIGIGRNDFTNATYRAHIKKGAQEFSRRKADVKGGWPKFAEHTEYMQLDLTADKTYKAIGTKVKEIEKDWGAKPAVIFYMSVAPQLAPVIAQKLHAAKLCEDPKRSRMVFEKPFGHDLQSAKALNDLLCQMFK